MGRRVPQVMEWEDDRLFGLTRVEGEDDRLVDCVCCALVRSFGTRQRICRLVPEKMNRRWTIEMSMGVVLMSCDVFH